LFYNHSQNILRDQSTSEPQYPAHDVASITDAQKRLLAELSSGPKRTSEIREALKLSSESLKYHLDTIPTLIERCNFGESLQLTCRGRETAVELGLLNVA